MEIVEVKGAIKMPFSIVGYGESADRSGTPAAITPFAGDTISDVSGDELRISSIPNPAIAYLYTKSEKPAYPVNSWKLNSPEIAACPLTGSGSDSIGSDTYFGTQISPLQVDTRAFPSGYGMTNSSPITCTMDTDDEAGVAQNASMVLAVVNQGESLFYQDGYSPISYYNRITGFSGSATVNQWETYSCTSSGLTFNSLPDELVRIVSTRVEMPSGTCYRWAFPVGSSARPGGLICNSNLSKTPVVNNFPTRPFRAITEHPQIQVISGAAETITSVEIAYQRV